jgi:adenosylcobyric acid synthase
MKGALLVAGTSSDAGKSVVVAGICRFLTRAGVRVAPFKAQNMSLNSVVTHDGAEIGRAQASQAAAARVEPEAAMNPVLLKPGGETSSQVVVMGRPLGNADARSYQALRGELAPVIAQALDDLRSRFDVVVCEGAGSLAEFNLRRGDLANMGLARAAGLPVVVVADIDRGGALASLFGSVAVLDPDDQALVGAFLLNKFRGDKALLDPGIDRLAHLTGRPILGVLPWSEGLWLDAEDSVALSGPRDPLLPVLGGDTLSVAVVRLPRISNFTDVDALSTEPGVAVSFTDSPADLLRADLVVLPGTKATVEDLAWLRGRGLADAVRERAAQGLPVLGICGGYQMLGKRIADVVESGAGEVDGLDLLPVETEFAADKVLSNRAGTATVFGGVSVSGYEIRHGRITRFGGDPVIDTPEGEEGCSVQGVVGISWHGALESDAYRRALLRWVSEATGRDWVAGSHSFAHLREERLDRLGDLIEGHVDIDALIQLIEKGAARDLPILESRLQTAGPEKVPPVEGVGPSFDDLRTHGDRMVTPGHRDFAVNVVPGGPPEWLRGELSDALGSLSRYPNDAEAIQALAERHGRASSEVLPTNGAAEAFWLVASALRSRRAVVVHPSFTEPEVALRSLGVGVTRAFRDERDFSLDPLAVPDDADLVFVCNPNNPTGTLDTADTVTQLIRAGRLVVVDEAFMDFCPGERESLANRSELEGVVVIRSITKLWSLPGIRAGYLLGPEDVVARLRAARQPWPVNVLALAALAACARRPDAAEVVAREVAQAKDDLVTGLREIPAIRVWPSVANFVLIRVPDGPAVYRRLAASGIAVRRAETFPGLSQDHLRVAVRTPEDNAALLAALRVAFS